MKKSSNLEKKPGKITKPIRGINWNDYYVGEKTYYQYGLTEQDVLKILDKIGKDKL